MTTPKIEDAEYQKNSSFWTRKGDNLTVMGDYLGRMPSLELIAAKPGEVILDAGCGAGFIARRLARAGARVYGCDRNEKMLTQAKLEEEQNPLGIQYDLADITELPYKSLMFDKIACVAVLIHDSPEDCGRFFSEAKRTLSGEGQLIISVMHPYLFQKEAPTRNGLASWVQYEPLDNLPMKQSQRFNEDYFNAQREKFSSVVWMHPEKVLLDLLKLYGLRPIHSQSKFVTPKVLYDCKQTGEIGYPAFLQIVAEKK